MRYVSRGFLIFYSRRMSAYDSVKSVPSRIEVEQLVESRYRSGERPLSWDDRIEGADVIRTTDGKTYRLMSDGGQSPPKKGWVLMLTGGDAEAGYQWTLYGLPQRAEIA